MSGVMADSHNEGAQVLVSWTCIEIMKQALDRLAIYLVMAGFGCPAK